MKWLYIDNAKVDRIVVNESEGKKPEQYVIRDINPNLQRLSATQITPNQTYGGAGTGGGGAGAAGADVGPPGGVQVGGNGGAGKASAISGSSVTRGGGGGGGSFDGGLHTGNNGNPIGGLGGSGGGGNGGKVSPTFSPFPGYGNLSRWTAGGVNLGGGGAGQSGEAGGLSPGGTGGSGTVIINEPAVTFVTGTSSCWDLRQVFRAVKAGNWV
jgi:hypothetical protein